MTELLIIHPGAQHGIFGELGDQLTALEPPTWARMIAGYFVADGVDTAICDAEALRLTPQQVASFVADRRPKLTVIVVSGHQPSASTQQMVGARQIALAIKQRDDSLVVAMAGNHPSALPRRTLREEAVDYVIDGEAPATIRQLLDDDAPDTIPGLVYWHSEGVIRQNPPAALLPVEALRGDAWHLLPMDAYRSHNWQAFGGWGRQPYASIYTTLGCPFKCSFCMINAFQHSNQYRMMPPQVVVDQIEHLYRAYGVRMFKIADEMFVLNERHYTAIADGLISRGLGDCINIWAYARVDTVKPEKLPLLRSAGIRWLALGIESGNADVRDGADKRLRTGDIVDVVRTIQRAGINVIGNFMFGLPDDDHGTMQQTYDLATACMPDFANYYCTMAYPGSRLYDEALAKGWTLPAEWGGYSQHNADCRPLDTAHISGRDVLRYRDAAFRGFYSNPHYRDHVRQKFGDDTSADIDRMLQYKLQRKLLDGAIT